jgi:hypothetical protein
MLRYKINRILKALKTFRRSYSVHELSKPSPETITLTTGKQGMCLVFTLLQEHVA